jgi:hypothetical protein
MAAQKKKLAAWLPEREAPLVLSGKALHSVIDADQPDTSEFRQYWSGLSTKISPPLE